IFVPSIAAAYCFTSSKFLASLTPPALPRPPAWIWALTTHRSPGMDLAASTASSGVRAMRPAGTAMPYSANSCFAWYSWKFMRHRMVWRTSHATGSRQAARARGGPVLSPIGGTRAKWRHTRQRRDTSDRGRGRLPTITARVNRGAEHALRRELYFYSLYRLLEASILVLVVFGPVAELLGPARHPMAASTVALT